MRLTHLALVALLAACVGDGSEACPDGQRRVCRAPSDCRCAQPCTPGAACPRAGAVAQVCAPLDADESMGACVDPSWLTGAPGGMFRCGMELCAASAQCVNWGAAGLRCAAPCTRNASCPSGCCTTIADRATGRTFNLCAPDTSFRCMGGASGLACDPPCAAGQTCVQLDGARRCARTCRDDADCPDTCCSRIEGGGLACAPTAAWCGSTLTPACTNHDDCVTVTYAARGDHCGNSPDSVEVRVRNDCTRPVDVQICYARRDGTCTCGMHRNVAPRTDATPAFWACDAAGTYGLSARAAGDAQGCHPGTCR